MKPVGIGETKQKTGNFLGSVSPNYTRKMDEPQENCMEKTTKVLQETLGVAITVFWAFGTPFGNVMTCIGVSWVGLRCINEFCC